MFSTVVMFCSMNTFCILSLNIVCRSNKGFMPDFFFFCLLGFFSPTTNTCKTLLEVIQSELHMKRS